MVPAGVEGHHAGEQVEVELLRGLEEVRSAVVAIGSHDLVLDLAASALRQRDPTRSLVSSNVGSLGGLVAVRDGLCHLAGSHLLDPATGTYTLPYLDRVLGPGEGVVIRLVHRQQGLLVAPGNPLGLGGVGDLSRAGRPLRQPPARRRHPGAARPRAGAARADGGCGRRLRAGGEHPPGRGRRRRLRPRRRRARDPRRCARLRARLRAGHRGALRPRHDRRRARDRCARPAARADRRTRRSAPRSRRSGATPPRRPAAGSGRNVG